jgi:hypothetical protein
VQLLMIYLPTYILSAVPTSQPTPEKARLMTMLACMIHASIDGDASALLGQDAC